MLALKFLETYVLLFTSDTDDFEKPVTEGNAFWLSGLIVLLKMILFRFHMDAFFSFFFFGLVSYTCTSLDLEPMISLSTYFCWRKCQLSYISLAQMVAFYLPDFFAIFFVLSILFKKGIWFVNFFGCTFGSLQQLADRLLIYHGWMVVTLFWTQLDLGQKQTELLTFS